MLEVLKEFKVLLELLHSKLVLAKFGLVQQPDVLNDPRLPGREFRDEEPVGLEPPAELQAVGIGRVKVCERKG